MVIFSSNTSYFSLYNYGLGHPTLCVNLSDSSGLDHSLGSRVIAVFSKRRCLQHGLHAYGVNFTLQQLEHGRRAWQTSSVISGGLDILKVLNN